jgi:hypothetical protein
MKLVASPVVGVREEIGAGAKADPDVGRSTGAPPAWTIAFAEE